jgi:hypothetical protein
MDQRVAKLLSKALDRDTFFISSVRLHDEASEVDLFVEQTSTDTISASNQLLSHSNGRALAVVDRTADITLAAKTLASTRLSPYDTSPYSPDLVIVNSFVIEEFVDACLKYAESIYLHSSPAGESASSPDQRKLIEDSETRRKLKVYASKTSQLKVLVLQDRYVFLSPATSFLTNNPRSSELLTTKITGSYLLILPSTSTTDTVTSQFNT